MTMKKDSDIGAASLIAEFVVRLRQLADSLKSGERFEVQIVSERVYVPVLFVRYSMSNMSGKMARKKLSFRLNRRRNYNSVLRVDSCVCVLAPELTCEMHYCVL